MRVSLGPFAATPLHLETFRSGVFSPEEAVHLLGPPRVHRPQHSDHIPLHLQFHLPGVFPGEEPQGTLGLQRPVGQLDCDPLRDGDWRLADTGLLAGDGGGGGHLALAGGAGGGERVGTGEEGAPGKEGGRNWLTPAKADRTLKRLLLLSIGQGEKGYCRVQADRTLKHLTWYMGRGGVASHQKRLGPEKKRL